MPFYRDVVLTENLRNQTNLLTEVGRNRPKTDETDRNWTKLTETGRNWAKLTEIDGTDRNWTKLTEIGRNHSKTDGSVRNQKSLLAGIIHEYRQL